MIRHNPAILGYKGSSSELQTFELSMTVAHDVCHEGQLY